jgi:phosphatidylinositol glycan class N
MIGGGLMFTVGILYLLFERSILADPKDEQSSPAADRFSRIIMGVQVGCSLLEGTFEGSNVLQIGLIALAMIVTHSSISYIQAREGLPQGTKYVGWITLGNYHSCQPES